MFIISYAFIKRKRSFFELTKLNYLLQIQALTLLFRYDLMCLTAFQSEKKFNYVPNYPRPKQNYVLKKKTTNMNRM